MSNNADASLGVKLKRRAGDGSAKQNRLLRATARGSKAVKEIYHPAPKSCPRRARGRTSAVITRAAIRQRGRVDTVQPGIVKALRDTGASVAITSSVGSGFPDLVVGWRGHNTLLECKTGTAKLTGDEAGFQMKWAGQLTTVRTPQEAVLAVIANSK